MDIRISVGNTILDAELFDSDLAREISALLPLEAGVNRWGQEIYFGIPLDFQLREPREVVEIGNLAYWPPGQGFCIFWGPTPASRGAEVRPASEVEVFGRVKGDATVLDSEPAGKVRIERI